MFRAINEYLAKINVVTDQSMYEAMSSFLEKTKLVDNFSINVNYNRYIVDIKMKKGETLVIYGTFRDKRMCNYNIKIS